MLKKHLILVMLVVMAALSANAGTWKMHNYYVEKKVQNIFDAGDKVYYLNSDNLFQYDKATQVTVALNKQNILSDSQISQIYYDWENRLLFVAYGNSNIDVIDSLGRVTNIPNIKDMISIVHNYSLSNGVLNNYTGKEIKDITFGNGVAYVAVGYGFVTIDESTLRVIKNYDLGLTICINSVCLMGDTLLILSNNRCYYGTPGDPDPIKNYQSVTGTFSNRKMYPLNDHSVFIYGANSGVNRYDFSSGTPVLTNIAPGSVVSMQKGHDGYYGNFLAQTACYLVNPEGTSYTKVSSQIVCMSSDPLGDGTVWVTDANGLHINGSTDYHKINSLTTDAPFWLSYNGVLNKLYVGVTAPNQIYNTVSTVANVVNTYDGYNWADATPYVAQGAGYEFVFNPMDPHMYVRASWNKGLFKVVDDVRISNYTKTTAPIATYKAHPAFDKYGNLWAVTTYGAADNPCVVLPKDKLSKTTTTKSDWIIPNGLLALNTRSFQRSRFIISKKNNFKIFSDCDYPSGSYTGHMICWDNGSEDPAVDNYRLVSIAHFVDQNNSQVDWVHLTHFEEDREGLIWIGHDAGLFVLDPDVVFDEIPRVTRPYASKFTEGKGYLCDTYTVYDVGVDRENNKWIATNNGLYYVSPDGSEVFNHFTVENSDIPSNTVFSAECDTINDRVYIFTDNGFAEYITHGDAVALNFDNVYAFPNPVEPNFTGMIKITGLMDNSYVTVTDHNGAVVAQFGPVMGSAFWDGSGADGERVPTGLYNIYAAQGGQPATTGTPRATVMIIK